MRMRVRDISVRKCECLVVMFLLLLLCGCCSAGGGGGRGCTPVCLDLVMSTASHGAQGSPFNIQGRDITVIPITNTISLHLALLLLRAQGGEGGEDGEEGEEGEGGEGGSDTAAETVQYFLDAV